MKSNDVLCSEAMQRATLMRVHRQNIALRRYSVCTLMLMVGLGVFMFKTIELQIAQQLPQQLTYGTGIYINNEVGAYVTLGVVMFVAGVVFTTLCIKLKEKED